MKNSKQGGVASNQIPFHLNNVGHSQSQNSSSYPYQNAKQFNLDSAQNFDFAYLDTESPERNQGAYNGKQNFKEINYTNNPQYNNAMSNEAFFRMQYQDDQSANKFFNEPIPDQEGFLKSILDQNLEGDNSDRFNRQVFIGGVGSGAGGRDDLNKIHQNFAGDTFSQISSTYEQQIQQIIGGGNNQQQSRHQQSQNEAVGGGKSNKNSNKGLHQYYEKTRSKSKQNNITSNNQQMQNNDDELLDSAILNNLNEDMNSPRDLNTNNTNNNMNMNHFSNIIPGNGNQIIDFQYSKNHHLGHNDLMPSPHSNLNNIIMNSDNLQQSDIQSTMTIYNSGIFDDASIMRILDKSISDDSLFLFQQSEDMNGGNKQQSQMRTGQEIENSFKFECEDVKQILMNITNKYKEKLQRQRQNGPQSASQFVPISCEELKSFEILQTSAIEKIRQIQALGKLVFDSQRVKSLSFKNYKQNLKIQLHNQIQKFKDICKRQYQQAEERKFKYQINEFENNEKIQQLEERLERQNEDINKLANKCEQLKYEKKLIAQKNQQKLIEMEGILKTLIKNLETSDREKLSKINNSFCLGTDHSMLLQPINKKRLQAIKQVQQMTDIQQSVDEKENESILSNHGHSKNYDNKELRVNLQQIKRLVRENKKINQIVKDDHQFQQQEGGSYYESSSILNLMGEFNNDNKRDSLIQQSQFIPAESSHADINQAFIQSQDGSSSSMQSQNNKMLIRNQKMNNINEEDDNNQSQDYKFDKDHILVVMDGNQKHHNNPQKSKRSLNDKLYLEDKISAQDLVAVASQDDISESQRKINEKQRIIMLQNKKNDHFDVFSNNNQNNSIDDDLNILKDLSKDHLVNNAPDLNFSNDLSGINDDFQFKNSGIQNGHKFGSGRDIFIADDFTGGSLDFNSRNDDKLYSGGSSQLSMIQAFQSSKRIVGGGSNDIFIVKVLDRKIQIPKLNLKIISEYGEPFKHNIPDIENSQESSLSQSQFPHSSKSQIMKQMIQTTDPPNITSFQNESISKQYQDQIENTQGSMKEDRLLDQAICIDNNSKIHNSQSSNKNSNAPAGGGFNMFDSFKQELSRLDHVIGNPNLNIAASSGEKSILNQRLEGQNDTLDLDESIIQQNQNDNIIFNDQFRQQFLNEQQKQQQQDYLQGQSRDKSIDLSMNVSRFKKSQSDPNIMFNDIDSDEEVKQQNNNNLVNIGGHHPQRSSNYQNFIQQDQSSKEKIQTQQLNFQKLKTPQNQAQTKFKFNQPPKEENTNISHQQDNLIQNPSKKFIRKSLGQFQNKVRSSAGTGANSNHDNDQSEKHSEQNTEVQTQQQQQPVRQIRKINQQQVINLISDQQISNHETTLSNQQSSGVRKSNQSPDLSSEGGQVATQKIKRLIQKPKNNRRDNSHNQQQNQDTVIIESDQNSEKDAYVSETSSVHNNNQIKSQLIQNYIGAAASMQGQNPHKMIQSKILNQKQLSQGTRNQLGFAQYSHPDMNNSAGGILKPDPYGSKSNMTKISKEQNSSMIQQMKEYSEQCDVSMNHNILRKKMPQNPLNEESKDNNDQMCVSPEQKRTSQSHTPQKKGLFVLNKQSIKGPAKIKILNSNNVTQNPANNISIAGVDNTQNVNQSNITNEDLMKKIKITKNKISMSKIILKNNHINKTVINQSVDNQNPYIQNQSVLVPENNAENSLMIHDISVINPPPFTQKPKATSKILVQNDPSTSLNLNQSVISNQINIRSLANKNIQNIIKTGAVSGNYNSNPANNANSSQDKKPMSKHFINKGDLLGIIKKQQQAQTNLNNVSNAGSSAANLSMVNHSQNPLIQRSFKQGINISNDKSMLLGDQSSIMMNNMSYLYQNSVVHNLENNNDSTVIANNKSILGNIAENQSILVSDKNYSSLPKSSNLNYSMISGNNDVKKVEDNKLQKRRRDILLKPTTSNINQKQHLQPNITNKE